MNERMPSSDSVWCVDKEHKIRCKRLNITRRKIIIICVQGRKVSKEWKNIKMVKMYIVRGICVCASAYSKEICGEMAWTSTPYATCPIPLHMILLTKYLRVKTIERNGEQNGKKQQVVKISLATKLRSPLIPVWVLRIDLIRSQCQYTVAWHCIWFITHVSKAFSTSNPMWCDGR